MIAEKFFIIIISSRGSSISVNITIIVYIKITVITVVVVVIAVIVQVTSSYNVSGDVFLAATATSLLQLDGPFGDFKRQNFIWIYANATAPSMTESITASSIAASADKRQQ